MIMLSIPSDKISHTRLDACFWLKADIAHKVIHVRKGGWHVSRLHGKELLDRRLSDAVLDCFYQVEQSDGLIVADVINPVWCSARSGVWIRAIPFFVWRGGLVCDA